MNLCVKKSAIQNIISTIQCVALDSAQPFSHFVQITSFLLYNMPPFKRKAFLTVVLNVFIVQVASWVPISGNSKRITHFHRLYCGNQFPELSFDVMGGKGLSNGNSTYSKTITPHYPSPF